jgi:hypothetical protein
MTHPFTDQDDTPLIGLPPPRPRLPLRLYRAPDWTGYDNGRWLARTCLRLVLALAAICALATLGYLVVACVCGVQQ